MIPIIREFGLFSATEHVLDNTSNNNFTYILPAECLDFVLNVVARIIPADRFQAKYLVENDEVRVKCLAMTLSQASVLLVQLNKYLA